MSVKPLTGRSIFFVDAKEIKDISISSIDAIVENGAIDEKTVKVTYAKCIYGTIAASREEKYNLPNPSPIHM